MNLRKYQQEAMDTVVKQFKKGVSKQLIVLPTGTGKTVLLAAIIMFFNLKTLVIAHREELIQQTKNTILEYCPNANVGICKAKQNELDKKIVIGSVQTCFQPNRLKQLKEKGFELLIIDEAHHAPAKSYCKIIEELGFMENPKKLLLGLTATPQRNDHLKLGDVFDEIVFERSISEMIGNGFLSPVMGRKISTDVSLKGIKSYRGDFIAKDLAEIINIPERNRLIAKKYIEHASNRKGIAFCVNVQHCHDLAETLCSFGVIAKAVWGKMDVKERKEILSQFRKDEIQVLTSCGILVEGYDEKTVNCIVMARSTKSKSLYIQCIGRGLRISNEKKDCLVLDFTDSYHNLNSLISLGSTISEAKIIKEVQKDRERVGALVEAEPVNAKVVETGDKEFDILGRNRFAWIPLEKNEYSLMDDNKNELVVIPVENGFTANFYQENSKTKIVESPLPLNICFKVCEAYAKKNLSMKYGSLNGSWLKNAKNQPATPSQKNFLFKHGIFAGTMNKAEASASIRKIIAINKQRQRFYGDHEPITEKQKNFLKRANINTTNMSKLQATRAISQIIQNDRKNITRPTRSVY